MPLVCIVSHGALTPELRRMICYGLGTEKPGPGKNGRWMGKGERGSFPPHPSTKKTFFLPSYRSWPGLISSVRPFPTTLQVPSDPPAPEAGAPSVRCTCRSPDEDGVNISWSIYCPVLCLGEHQIRGFVKTRCPAPRVSCVRNLGLSRRVKFYSQVSLTLVTFLSPPCFLCMVSYSPARI